MKHTRACKEPDKLETCMLCDGTGKVHLCPRDEGEGKFRELEPIIEKGVGCKSKNIAEEAIEIVYGDGEQAYDDPNINFEKLGLMWTGHLLKKLKPGEAITPADVALMQVMLKISREGFKPKRDNRTDIIGYTLCLDRVVGG